MNLPRIFLLTFLLLRLSHADAQIKPDSAMVAGTLAELLRICKTVDFSDPKVQQLGTFYKAAPYIVYQGNDASRKWKDVANYSSAEEKKQVDEICSRINSSVNQDSSYTFTNYSAEKESEGEWHVIIVSFRMKGEIKRSAFAFLKIGNKYALGDID